MTKKSMSHARNLIMVPASGIENSTPSRVTMTIEFILTAYNIAFSVYPAYTAAALNYL